MGDDTGDAPGEFQFWAEREKLTEKIDVPGAPHALCRNADGLYGTVAGNTPDTHLTAVRTSELIMALCLDPRWDLRKTYWLINGIAGIDPAAGSIGSAVWTGNVVDGDAMREISELEMPAGWPYGLFANRHGASGRAAAENRQRRVGRRGARLHDELSTQPCAHALGL